MTKRLEQAMERARSLPADLQDEIASLVLAYAGEDDEVLELTPEEDADLLEARCAMEGGEFAEAAAVEAVCAKYRG